MGSFIICTHVTRIKTSGPHGTDASLCTICLFLAFTIIAAIHVRFNLKHLFVYKNYGVTIFHDLEKSRRSTYNEIAARTPLRLGILLDIFFAFMTRLSTYIVATKWRIHRKLIMPTFNSRILESFVEVFAKQSEVMTRQMRKELDAGEFDIFHYISLCTLDIICGERILKGSENMASGTPCIFYNICNTSSWKNATGRRLTLDKWSIGPIDRVDWSIVSSNPFVSRERSYEKLCHYDNIL